MAQRKTINPFVGYNNPYIIDLEQFRTYNDAIADRQAEEYAMQDIQPQVDDNSWGITRGFTAGAAGVLQGQAQLGNLMGIGDGSTANYLEEVMKRNARKKEYTIGDMLPFASDYWTNGEGAAYDIANMLGSSVVLGGETAAAAATGGAALGALGVGSRAAAAATALGKSATAARATFMTDAITSGMAKAANKIGMTKLANVLEGPMGKLYAANILKTPLEASSEAGNAGAEALANGASLDDAQRQALIVGGLQTPLLALSNTIESAGLGGLFMKEAEKATGQKVGKEGLLAILGSVTREGMRNAWEEGMQQSTHEYAAGKQSLLGVVNPLQWSDEAAQQAAVGAVGGLAIGGGNAALRGYATRETASPAAEDAAATTPTPAQLAREYLDEQGQQEGKFTPEQQAAMWEAAENGDDQTVIDLATQMGWQNPEAQQGQEQAQPAPITPASTPEEQIQTATNAVNAATAAVVNGGQVADNGGQGTNTSVEQTTQQPMQQPTQTATPAASVDANASSDISTATPTNDVVNNFITDIAEKLKDGKYKALVNADNTLDVGRLRQQFNIKKYLNEHPEASAVAKAALSGDKKAIAQFKKYAPEHRAAALDEAINGDDNWKFTDQELQKMSDDEQQTVTRQVTQIRQQMNNKIKGKKKDNSLTPEQQNELASAASSTDLGKILDVAKTYGIAVPSITRDYYDKYKGDGATPVEIKNTLAPKNPQSNPKGDKGKKGSKKTDTPSGDKGDNSSGSNGGEKNVEGDNNNTQSEVKIPDKLGDKTSDGESKGVTRFKTDDGRVKYTLNPKTNEVTRRIDNKKTEKIQFESLKEAMNFIADDVAVEKKNSWIADKIGDFVTDKDGDNDSTTHDYYLLNGADNKGIDSARVTKHIMREDKNHKPLEVEYSVLFYDADGETLDNYDVKTIEEVEKILTSKGEPTEGGNIDATSTNGTGENGTGEGNENPVQDQQSKEPVQTKTDDNKGEGENGEVKVDEPSGEPAGQPTQKPTKKTTKEPVQKPEPVALDKVLEKYKDNADDRGIIRRLTGVSKLDAPIAKQHNSTVIKKLADDIMEKYTKSEIGAKEAHEQMSKLNSAYSQSSSIFVEVDGVNGKKYVSQLTKDLRDDLNNMAALAKKNREKALVGAKETSQKILQELKEDKKNFDDALESIEKLKNYIIKELEKLGVKKLGVAERKAIYDEPIKEAGKIQKAKDEAAAAAAATAVQEPTSSNVDNDQGTEGEGTPTAQSKKLTPAEMVKEKVTALENLENEIQDYLDENTGELTAQKRMQLMRKADNVSIIEDELSDVQADIVLAAKDKFKAALKLAEAQSKADAAGTAIKTKEKPTAVEVSDAVSGFIDTALFGDSKDTQLRAQEIILKYFSAEDQEVLQKQDLAAINGELSNVYDDKEELESFVSEATEGLENKTADLVKGYIDRLKDAFAKADAIFKLQDEYDQKAAKLAGLQKTKYSVRIGGKLGETMYQAAWHGTPHIIEGNLTTERIGSGEGAIVHGWGLYFAKSREISQVRYRDRLIKKNGGESQGELLKVEIPENDKLLDEEKKFERQPFRVRQALKNIFSKLPSTERPTKDWDRAVKDLEKLLPQEEFQKVINNILDNLKSFNLNIANTDSFSKLNNKLWNSVTEIINNAVDSSLKPLREAVLKELNGQGESKVEDWEAVVNSVEKKLTEEQYDMMDSLGLFSSISEFGFSPTIDDLKYSTVRKLLLRSGNQNYKPYALPKVAIDARDLLKGKSGWDIYGILARALSDSQDLVHKRVDWNGAKLASLELNKYGIKGIHYIGGTDGECFVIFDDDAIAIKQRYDAALRKHQEELQRSRGEVISKIKSMFAGSKFEEQENGDLLITTKGGNKILYKIADRILLNGAEAQEARKAHGIADDAEVSAEGRYRTVYEGNVDAMVEVGLDSRKNTEAHETTHAVINLALGEEGSKPLFERAEKLIKEYGLKADKEEVACDAVRDFITARENGFITTFTADERAELSKTFWGRMMLKANEMGAKAKVLSDKNEAELSKAAWGKLLLAKLKLQRNLAKLMRNVYDFYKKFKAARDANESFHNLARKIELGEVWNEKKAKSVGDAASKLSLNETISSRENLKETIAEWERQLELFKNKALPSGNAPIKVMEAPVVIQLAGAKEQSIYIDRAILHKILEKSNQRGGHAEDMSYDIIKALPGALTDPMMIVKAADKNEKEVLVSIVSLKDKSGRPIVVPVIMDVAKDGNILIDKIESAYGKNALKNPESLWLKRQMGDDDNPFGKLLYINKEKTTNWAKSFGLQLPLGLDQISGLDNGSIATKEDVVNYKSLLPEKYSARPSRKRKDPAISSINLKYKEELEEAFERNANAGEITAIQNRHQDELAKYLKEKGEKQKEKAKLRAAELRELRKKLKAHEIDSFEMAGGKVTLDKDGKEKFESIQDPNELPTFVYKNNQHNDEAYKNASSLQKLNASIKRPEEKSAVQTVKDYIKNARDKFYKQWVDKYDALGILDKAIAKKGGKPADESMTILNRMQFAANNAMGAARALIEGDENSLKPLAEKWGFKKTASLKMVLQKLEADHKSGKYADYIKKSSLNGGTLIQDYLNGFESFLTANTLLESARNHKLDYDREVAEWKKKGSRGEKPKETPYKFPNNLSEEDIKEIISNAPPVFKIYQKMFKNVTDNMLDIMLKSGLITSDRYDTLKDRYKYYCPLFRDFSDTAAVDDFIGQINAGRGMANVSDPLKSRSSEGSYRDVMSPLTSAVKSISAICAKAERNRVGQYAVRQAKKHHLNDYIREIKGNAGDAKNCVFTVMINGEKHAYQTTPELYPAITAAVEPLCKLDFALLTKPAQILRYGSTMSPSFIIRNFLRDTIFATVSSKNGFIPIYDSIRGGWTYTHNKILRGEYEAAGVASSNYYSDSEAVMKGLNEMAGGKTWQEKTPMDIIKATLKYPLAKLEWWSEVIENSTRMGEFVRARAKGKSIEQAGHDAVEVSLNFNRSGATGQQINKMVPFFNACIQGGDKLYRLFKSDPRGTMLRIGLTIVLPSIALWAWNHDEDWYKDLDPNIKMTNWIIGGLRIPKPQEAGILFGSGVEALLDTANGQDPQAMKEWRHNVIEALTPGFLPTVILPIIEWIANYSFFRGKPIVNQGMQRLPAEMQYGPYTSESAKFIGQTAKDVGLGGVSPAKIDNFFRGYTGTMGMFLFQSPDWFAAEKQNLPEKKLIEMPIARDFIINEMNFNRTMNDFYKLKDAATKQHAGYGKKGKPSPEVAGVNVATQSIQKLQKEAREITASNKYNSAQKRAMIDKLKAKQDKIARAAIKKYGSKFDI